MSRFVWGVITQTGPLEILIDGDTTPLPLADRPHLIDTTRLKVGDVVRCEIAARRIVLHERSGGSSELETRTITYTTSSLANGATETGVIELRTGFTILHFKAVQAARFRAYQSTAHRTADASRAVGVYPSGDHGLIFEDDGAAAADYATVVVGGLLAGQTSCPIAVTNRSGATRTITIELEVRV